MQWAQGLCPSHFVRSWLHWSQARLILRLTGPELLFSSTPDELRCLESLPLPPLLLLLELL